MVKEAVRSAPPTTGVAQRERLGHRSARSPSRSVWRVGMWVGLALVAACGAWKLPIDAGEPATDPSVHITAPGDEMDLDESEVPGAPAIAPTTIPVVTYEGSGELVHPDVAFFPRGFAGMRYWYAATPYPSGNSGFENPSIFNGRSSGEMQVPAGISNPLVKPEANGYLSDPDVTYDPEKRELRMYYRQTLLTGDQVFLARSSNGVNWSRGQLVLGAPRYALISPAIVREGASKWRMWTVNATVTGCRSSVQDLTLEQRRSDDGVNWDDAEPVKLSIPGHVPWHWDVQYVRAKNQYWSLIAAYPDGGNCSQTAVYLARSADGTTWDVSPSPLLRAGDFPPIRDLVYRSTFRYHEGSDEVSVWFSGARYEDGAFHYGVALARYPFAEMMRRVSSAPSAALAMGEREHVPRELRAARAAFVAAFP